MSKMSSGFKKLVSLILGVVLIMGSLGIEGVSASQMDKVYTMEDLSRMRTSDLIEVLSTVDKDNIKGLFKFSDAAYDIYSDERKMNAVLDALMESAEQFTEDDDMGIPTLTYFIRSAIYLGFYDRDAYRSSNSKLITPLSEEERVKGKYEKFFEREFRDKYIPAIIAMQNNPNFKAGTKVQDSVVKSAGELLGGASSNPDAINGFIPVLEDFYENIEEYINDDDKPSVFHKVISNISYELSTFLDEELDILKSDPENEILKNYEKTEMGYEEKEKLSPEERMRLEEVKNSALKEEIAKNSKWFGQIDGYIELLVKFSELPDKRENTMVLENTSHGLANIGILHTDKTIGNKALTQAMKDYNYLSRNYIRVAHDIDYYYGGINAKGENINFKKIREESQEKYYGNIYKFDDGELIIRAGDNVRKDKILKFYWATKEVEAQYFRALDTDEPVELKPIKNSDGEMVKQNRTDNILTMIIYNDKYEYEINSSINDLATNNGGMYIKDNGTLYTFERPRTQSTYNLEELIKHEYTHYMQGRYVANAKYWGEEEFYESGNMTWYEEGGAEYFAGATRVDGVVERSSILKDAFNTDNQYSFIKGLNSGYSDSNSLYYHAFLLMNYAIKHEPEIYDTLTQYIREDNFEEFEKYVNKLKNKTEKEANYRKYLEDLKNNLGNLYVPNASERYLDEHIDKDANEILEEVRQTTGLKDLKYEVKSSDKFETIKIEGTYHDNAWYRGKIRDREKMNEIADNMLKNLSELEWSGYDTFTMYFKNYRVDDNNNFVYDVVLHGVKSSEKFVMDPKDIGRVYPVISSDDKNKTKEYIRFTSWESTTENGDIYEYKWIIDGKEYTSDYVDFMFDEPGEYEIKLIVVDELGVVGETSKIVKIERRDGEEAPDDPTQSNEDIPRINEEEPNNDFTSANLLSDSVIVGEVDYDDEDYFYFDIEKEGDYTVELVKLLGDSCTFNIYSEKNMQDKFSYATFIPGTSKKIRSKEHYSPGRYFIKVYAYKDETIKYELELK